MKKLIAFNLGILLSTSLAAQTLFLREDTASQVISLGPFLDPADGTAEGGLTIANTDVRLKLDGGADAAKNSGGCTHDINGMYDCTFNATDTADSGNLNVSVCVTGAVCVSRNFIVLEQNVYDILFPDAATLGTRVNEIDDILADTGTDGVQIAAGEVDDTALNSATELQAAAAAALVAINLDHLVGTAAGIPAIPADTYLDQIMDDGTASFDRTTDSLQAIRDRGDAAWTTGAGGSSDPQGPAYTTVATAPTTTTVTLTAAPNDDTQLEGFAIYFEDNGDADSYCLRKVSSISSGTITYDSACPFTVAAGDVVKLLPAFLDEGVAVESLSQAALANLFDTDSGETSASAVSGSVVQEIADLAAGGGLTEAGIADAVLLELVSDHSGTAGSLAATLAAILQDTGTTLDDFVDGLESAVSTLQTSVDDIPTNAELATSQAAADDATLAAIAGLNNVSTAQIQALLDAGVLSLGYVNAGGDVCTMIISESDPKLTLDCVEVP